MLAHIILNVKDFAESEKFYDMLLPPLGWKFLRTEDEDAYAIKAYWSDQWCDFMIRYDKKTPVQDFVRNVGLDHICLKAKSKESIDSFHSMVESMWVKITRSPAHYPDYSDIYYAFYFRDPSGIPLEVAYY